MPEDRDESKSSEPILAVPGVLYVGAVASGRRPVLVGPAAGWMVPRGIAQWERELSFVRRVVLTPEFATALRATRPADQIAPKRFPLAKRAVDESPLLPIASNLVHDARAQGVRVHTVGVDRVSGDFFYFEEGGELEAVRVQGNLVEMLAPSLAPSSTNAEIATLLDGLIDRLLASLSGGVVSELAVELADALPRLSRDGTGMAGVDLEAFEARAAAFAGRAAQWEAEARRIPAALAQAGRQSQRTAAVALFGEARQDGRPAIDVLVAGKTLKLPERPRWTVTGEPRKEEPKKEAPPAIAAARPTPSPSPAVVARKPTPSPSPAVVARKPTPSPSPAVVAAKAGATPGAVRPSPAPAKPTPSPSPARVSPAVVARATEPVKPAPLRLTPIPPRPEAKDAPVAVPAPAPAPIAVVEPAPAAVVPPVPPATPAAAPAVAPAAPERAAEPVAVASADVERSAATVPPVRDRAAVVRTVSAIPAPPKKSSPIGWIVILLALAAISYVALMHR
jgi:hypothetical protein